MVAGPDPTKPNVILTPDSRLRVFISSTLKELAEEREAVRQSILKLRLLPVMFEAGARPHPARELYQAYLSQSHVFIGIYWQSYGWVGPGMEISGLEDEFNLSAGLPRLIYVKSPAPNREPGLQHMLTRLQEENSASYKHFSSRIELGELVENDLALLLSETYESASRNPAVEFTPKPLTNIPFPRNPLLGRAHELETLCSWLSQDTTSLVTLTGPGGTGKSRLALEAALELRSRFADGVYLVRLTPVSDPERVIPAIAEALGLRETAQARPVEEILANHLRNRSILLVLDNFEQILAAAPKVAQLLEACPRLKILVTSRAPLHVRGERELPVAPLAIPDPKKASGYEQLSQYASVELFIQRAQGIRPDFTVTSENAPAIAEICYRLDGLPLAIELAAARIKLLSPQGLLARLAHRFDILRGGARDLPERQQTLRGAIDWSYNLLSEPSRAIFRRLSIFAGGFSIEAAEAVCNLGEDADLSILEQVEALLDSSLLLPVEGLEGHPRFAMLETIREYASERLHDSNERARVRRLHAEYFLRFAHDVEPRVRTSERVRWRDILEQDLENIRGVLKWASADPDAAEIGEELLFTLLFFWAECGYLTEGQRYCQSFLARDSDATPLRVRAGLLATSGGITLLQGDTRPPQIDWAQTVALARQSGDADVLVISLLLGGAWALSSQNFQVAAGYLEECQQLCHKRGDEWTEVLATLWLSNTLAMLGQAARSKDLFDIAVASARRQGDQWLLVVPLIDVAQDAYAAGDLDKSESTLLEVETILRRGKDLWTLAWPLTVLGQIELARGRLPLARNYISEALNLAREYGNLMAEIFALAETAALLGLLYGSQEVDPALRGPKLMDAARLCGATQPFHNLPILLGSTLSAQVFKSMLAQVGSAVGEDTWKQGYAEGASMPLEQAMDLAARELTALST